MTTLTPGRAPGHWHHEIQWGGLSKAGKLGKHGPFSLPVFKACYPVIALDQIPASTPAQLRSLSSISSRRAWMRMILSPPRCSLLFLTQVAGWAAGSSEQLLGCQGPGDVIPATVAVTDLGLACEIVPKSSRVTHT